MPDAGDWLFRRAYSFLPRLPQARKSCGRRRCPSIWFSVRTPFLAVAFAGQRLLDSPLLPGLQIKCVALDVLDDVFLQDLSLKAFECAFQTLAILNSNFCQRISPRSSISLQSNSFPSEDSGSGHNCFLIPVKRIPIRLWVPAHHLVSSSRLTSAIDAVIRARFNEFSIRYSSRGWLITVDPLDALQKENWKVRMSKPAPPSLQTAATQLLSQGPTSLFY